MFVSSYNTYVYTNSSNKISKEIEETKEKLKSFQHSLLNAKKIAISPEFKTSISYISKGQVQYNKKIFELQEKKEFSSSQNEYKKALNSTSKFNTTSLLKNASTAYKDNFQKFATFKKQKTAFNQTLKIGLDTPKEIQTIQEKNMRTVMIYTYNENNNYYFSYH